VPARSIALDGDGRAEPGLVVRLDLVVARNTEGAKEELVRAIFDDRAVGECTVERVLVPAIGISGLR
jgi:hypothetical protein